MRDRLKLDTPITVSGDDIEKAWAEQAKEVSAVSSVLELLRGVTAERAAAELNTTLDIDVFTWFARGWTTVEAVRDAMQRSLLAPDPPSIIRLDQHSFASTSQLVLNADAPNVTLPELVLAMVLSASVASATLGIRDGGFELLALGEATVVARLFYGDLLLKQHAATVEGAARDPFRHRRPAEQPVSL
jgi:hypothetical protein